MSWLFVQWLYVQHFTGNGHSVDKAHPNQYPACHALSRAKIMITTHKKSRIQQRTTYKTKKSASSLSRGTMVSDVCLVVVWAASIPGLMWLGAVGGF